MRGRCFALESLLHKKEEQRMRTVLALILLALAGSALASDTPQYTFTYIVKVGDGKPKTVSGSYPRGTTNLLPVADHLVFVITTPTGREEWPMTSVKLVDDSSGELKVLANWRDNRPAAQERKSTYTLCGERVIVLNPSPASPGNCADLPRMAKADPIIGNCGDCLGPYEGMPNNITPHGRIAPIGEPGEPLTLTGHVLGGDGKPRSGVIVYAYHTNAQGLYPPPNPPRSAASNHQGTLRGWAKSDAQGAYTFDTIRPAGYPGGEPQHIHMHVIEPGCGTYYIEELLFTDDPRLTDDLRKRMNTGRGGNNLVTPTRDANGTWQVVRDVHLGAGIPEYTGCSARS
jgi:protocatechuate 3,4-dioxygenase beta subunit